MEAPLCQASWILAQFCSLRWRAAASASVFLVRASLLPMSAVTPRVVRARSSGVRVSTVETVPSRPMWVTLPSEAPLPSLVWPALQGL